MSIFIFRAALILIFLLFSHRGQVVILETDEVFTLSQRLAACLAVAQVALEETIEPLLPALLVHLVTLHGDDKAEKRLCVERSAARGVDERLANVRPEHCQDPDVQRLALEDLIPRAHRPYEVTGQLKQRRLPAVALVVDGAERLECEIDNTSKILPDEIRVKCLRELAEDALHCETCLWPCWTRPQGSLKPFNGSP